MDDKDLFPNSPEKYKEDYHRLLLEQYKTYVEMADRIIERRNKTNTFFLSANSFLLSALGILSEFDFLPNLGIWWLYIASSGGVVFAITWLFIVRSYRQLSSAKYHIINDLEKELPSSPYTKEWKVLESGKNWRKYTRLTKVETFVPATFVGLYVALSLGASFWG